MQQGDLIALGIDTDVVEVDADNGAESNATDSPSTTFPSRATGAAFFVITNVEHAIHIPLQANGHPSTKGSWQDSYAGATLGELGCWFDPTTTRMVQTGVEHTRVPDVRTYLSIDKVSLSSDEIPITTPQGKLLALSSAALARHAVDYALQLSFLLTGARGIGKYSAAELVARKLGVHLLEVCFRLSEVKSR